MKLSKKSNNVNQKLKSLPQSPGVYKFHDKNGKLLYVGKAGSLKDRVNSYFVGVPACRTGRQFIEPDYNSGLINQTPTYSKIFGTRPIEMMISEVADIEIKKTDTVLEAYILEQNLIKKWQPKYNAMGKDDKSFSYVAFTKEEFSRPIILRGTDISQITNNKLQITNKFQIQNSKFKNIKFSKIYGPYTSKKQIEIALKILRKIFPYHNKPQKTEKGCLDAQIGLCPGPYDGAISKEDYAKNIRGIKMILEGKKKSLLGKMKKEMEAYSKKNEFEKAAEVRNKIFALQRIQDVALIGDGRGRKFSPPTGVAMRIEGYDISNISGKYAVGSMVVFDNSGGELQPNKSQYRKFKIKTIFGANDVGAMKEVLIRRFRNNWSRPSLIILDGGAGHLNMARRVLGRHKIEVPLLAVAKGPTRKKLDLRSFGSVPKLPEKIIESVRDEAHRFAISYHRKIRAKAID